MIFLSFAQNTDCGYTLEAPWRGGVNEYHNSCFGSRILEKYVHPCIPQFNYIKVGCKVLFITRTSLIVMIIFI